MNSHVAEPFRSILESLSHAMPDITLTPRAMAQMEENVRTYVSRLEMCQGGCKVIKPCWRYRLFDLAFINLCDECAKGPRFSGHIRRVDANGNLLVSAPDPAEILQSISDFNRELDQMYPQDDAA